MGLNIIKPGWQSLVMDMGRQNARAWGFPQSGVLDPFQYRWANGLVGYSWEEATKQPVIEIRSGDVLIRFENNLTFAITGAEGTFLLDEKTIRSHKSYKAKKGQKLHIRKLSRNGTLYLAVQGTWEIPSFWNSHSADILSPFPELSGRTLRAHDRIRISPKSKNTSFSSFVSPENVKFDPDRFDPIFRITRGPELSAEGDRLVRTFENSGFEILRDSNRMGYRLLSSDPEPISLPEIISTIVVPGMIQWPPGNRPILLLPNCQTTGGYPRVAKVIEADMWKLAYVGPGDVIRFQWSTSEEAIYLSSYQESQFRIAWENLFSS